MPSRLAGLASGHPVGALPPVLAEDRDRQRAQETELADGAAAAGEAPPPARAPADGEPLQPHRIAVLEHLRIGDRGVRHVAVNGVRAGEAGPGAGAAADGLVVAEAAVAEEHVVHRPLAAGGDAQRLEQQVDEPLAGLDVAADDRRRALRVRCEVGIQDTARDDQLDRRQQTLVERQRLGDQQAQDVEHDAAHHRRSGVQVAGMHAGAAAEIDLRALANYTDARPQGRAVVQLLDRLEFTVAETTEGAPGLGSRQPAEGRHLPLQLGAGMGPGEPQQGLDTLAIRGHRRCQVDHVLLDGPRWEAAGGEPPA